MEDALGNRKPNFWTDPITRREFENIGDHVFSIELEGSFRFKTPSLQLAIGSGVVDFRCDFNSLMSLGIEGVKENLIDVS